MVVGLLRWSVRFIYNVKPNRSVWSDNAMRKEIDRDKLHLADFLKYESK